MKIYVFQGYKLEPHEYFHIDRVIHRLFYILLYRIFNKKMEMLSLCKKHVSLGSKMPIAKLYFFSKEFSKLYNISETQYFMSLGCNQITYKNFTKE